MLKILHSLTAILPCNDVPRSRAFYERLGSEHQAGDDDYAMLQDARGAQLHLQPAVEGWLTPGRNPFGLYLYTENVDELATRFPGQILGKSGRPEENPGACMSSPFPIPTKRSCVSDGPPGCVHLGHKPPRP